MSKHTPGPWKTGDCDGWIVWAPRFGCTDWVSKGSALGEPEAVSVAIIEAPAWTMPLPSEEREAWLAESTANARLIAAAPDMLAVLRAISDAAPDLPDAIWNQVDSALAKAIPRNPDRGTP